MSSLNELCKQGRMTWIEPEHGWLAAPDEVVGALSNDGFEECKREMTTSRRDRRPAGGVWQGVNTATGSGASAIWVSRPVWPQAIVFIDVDGESLGAHGLSAYGISDPVDRVDGEGASRTLAPDPPAGEAAVGSGTAGASLETT